jgi:deoxyribodipyrimidine photo-lyase
MFAPSKRAAESALEDFLPKAGTDYAADRNSDYGPNRHHNVSTLSPWIRTRMLTEWAIIQSVLEEHSEKSAAKFIDEVCWRTYWKGWLQLRPAVWEEYLSARAILLEEYSGHLGYEKAIAGETGIDCFDAWATELAETGYLHNHARMWAASIWIHTLKLPWELGADWFLRHLLDGDAASNTLSWRWVAGLHTRGKSYLATTGNIQKYTSGRFSVNRRLATAPIPVPESTPPSIRPLSKLVQPGTDGRIGLLLTEDDLSASDWLPQRFSVDAVSGFLPSTTYKELGIDEKVIDFRRACLAERSGADLFESIDPFIDWCTSRKLSTVLMAEPPVGLWTTTLPVIKTRLFEEGIELLPQRHWWDEIFYPKATHGFFRFKQAIPSALKIIKEPAMTENHV